MLTGRPERVYRVAGDTVGGDIAGQQCTERFCSSVRRKRIIGDLDLDRQSRTGSTLPVILTCCGASRWTEVSSMQ